MLLVNKIRGSTAITVFLELRDLNIVRQFQSGRFHNATVKFVARVFVSRHFSDYEFMS